MFDIALKWNCMKWDSDGMFDMALELNCMKKDSDDMFDSALALNEVVDNMFWHCSRNVLCETN